jgi:hypothetical protein
LIHVPQTQISLDAEVSELSFVLPSEKPVVGRTRVSQLGVSGADAIHLSPDLIQTFNASSHSDSPLNIRLTAVTNSSSSGAINTAALIPPPGTRVWLCFMGPSNAYRLSLKAPQNAAPVALQADARGEVEMAAPGLLDRPRVLDFGKSGGSVQFEANKDVMDVDFELIDTADWQFYAQVPIQHLEFTRIDEFTTPEGSLVAPMSTLLGGALYLESLTGEKRELRAGERLQFSSSIGRIETLRLENGRILVKFRGRVAGMKIGDDSTSRNLMPNLLEWLKARQPLSLLWGATVFVYGIAASVMRWYQRSP